MQHYSSQNLLQSNSTSIALQNQLKKQQNFITSEGIPISQPSIHQTTESEGMISFQDNGMQQYAELIWIQSMAYLKSAFPSSTQREIPCRADILQASLKNQQAGQKNARDYNTVQTLSLVQQKSEAIQLFLKNNKSILLLLLKLSQLFRQTILQQLTHLICLIIQKQYLPYKEESLKKKRQLENSGILPYFKCFYDFDQEQLQKGNCFPQYSLDQKALLLASEEGIEKIALDFYFSEQIKYLNLQEFYRKQIKYSEIQNQLLPFVKIVSKIIFASAEGIYRFEELPFNELICFANTQEPSKLETVKDSFFELYESDAKRAKVRYFSEINSMEYTEEFNSLGSKKVKSE